ncbi:DNA (cytosine-5-)-methyltransferase [Capsulimonas corticalis]|uniref:DNA (Cytosine-5-)-methyltransferase n=1 Tax=Capsulimonas corticalis TaxID=2219043 RepID=A0A402CZ56_9BACT|nr:DNA (cytosine-5-)-methyltransferase [Capsulimonas corticalis]BDI29529.1 DNA (cytosine-5-)-methyltransferase [Capsulimonas corticalis]
MQTISPSSTKPAALDFFAGGGLASEGLKSQFDVVWANDFAPKKALVYQANHPGHLHVGPIQEVRGGDLPAAALAWASFPCQDLSLAGRMLGMHSGTRSGLVWEWLRILGELRERPPVVVAENVSGLLSSEGGAHFRMLHAALSDLGYRVGALALDAARWLPQSRPRVFVVGARRDLDTKALEALDASWAHSEAVRRVSDTDGWVWWDLPEPPQRTVRLSSLIDRDAPVHADARAAHALSLLSDRHRRKLSALANGDIVPGYRRVRDGRQVLELRFDGVAGCLRTPSGGSSRQVIVIRRGDEFQTRLLTVREAARLMGAPETYQIPGSYNDGYKAMGDAVAVPVVEHLARHLLASLARIANVVTPR